MNNQTRYSERSIDRYSDALANVSASQRERERETKRKTKTERYSYRTSSSSVVASPCKHQKVDARLRAECLQGAPR